MDITPLLTIKSQNSIDQRTIIDELTRACLGSCSSELQLVMNGDSLLDFSRESETDIVRYCLLTIYAADIASVPYAAGRERHLARLKDLVQFYNLNYDRVIHLTKHERALLEILQRSA